MEEEQKRKANVFASIITNAERYAWAKAKVLKEKFGDIETEEQYLEVETDILDYMESKEYKVKVLQEEFDSLTSIIIEAEKEININSEELDKLYTDEEIG